MSGNPQNKPVSSSVVANEFIRLAKEDGKELTPMKLLKMVYLAHGWMLGNYQIPLIGDPIEAWMYGPVIPELYEKLRHLKGDPVNEKLSTMEDTDALPLSEKQRSIIRQVYQNYKQFTGPQLSTLTHMQGTPWSIIQKARGDWASIPNSLIQKHYEAKVRASLNK